MHRAFELEDTPSTVFSSRRPCIIFVLGVDAFVGSRSERVLREHLDHCAANMGRRNWDAAEGAFNQREESGLMDVMSTILLLIDKMSINEASGRESMDNHVK